MIHDGWICEAHDAPNGSWMNDAAWSKANKRHGHCSMIWHKTGVMKISDQFGFVKTKTFLSQLFYGDSFEDRQMMGFARRYSTRDPQQAQSAACVHDAGGVSHLSSIWLVGWGLHTAFIATPDGEPVCGAGEAALVISDYRYIQRIANVDLSIDVDVRALLDKACLRMPSAKATAMMRPVFYMNSRIYARVPTNLHRGIFIRVIDDIRNDEDRVPGAGAAAA